KRVEPASFLYDLAPVAPDQDATHPGAVNRVGIPTDSPAVLLQAGPLRPIHVRSRRMAVPLVGVLGHDPEQPELAITANQQWRRRFLDGTGQRARAAEWVVTAVEVDRSARPERLDDGDALLESVEPLLEGR